MKAVNDLDDEYILFFESLSESSMDAAKLSHEMIAKRTEDSDIPVLKECWGDQQKAVDDFCEDKYDTLGMLQRSNIPILVVMEDHDISCRVENWYTLVGKLPSTQFIVMPQAGHGPQHQYPDLATKYSTLLFYSKFEVIFGKVVAHGRLAEVAEYALVCSDSSANKRTVPDNSLFKGRHAASTKHNSPEDAATCKRLP